MTASPSGNGGVDTKRTTFKRHDHEMANNDWWLLNLPQLYEESNLKNELMSRYENLLVNYLPSLQQQRLNDM